MVQAHKAHQGFSRRYTNRRVDMDIGITIITCNENLLYILSHYLVIVIYTQIHNSMPFTSYSK